ncbi:PQQ-binding-like beta-propeller repeat protein [Spirillospora sp. NPDC047279]|uniref:outer membrane protein assembly factor BamB family protein n=1 Tax=Spirillospora sp. NPDC047279 TaxID=3155478 RepID=UPI0033FA69CF
MSLRVLRGGTVTAAGLLLTSVLVGCGSDSPGGGDVPLLWRLDGRALAGAEKQARTASWLSGPTLAVTRARDVTGYDAATGKARWTVALPGRVCEASALASKGRVAVQFGPDGRERCGRIAVVDLTSGTKVWERPISSAAAVPKGQVVIGGDAVVVRTRLGTAAYALGDGRPRWTAPSPRRRCGIEALAGGHVLVASYECGRKAGGPRHVRGLDPATGRPRWSYAVPAGQEVAGLPSAAPAVVALRPVDTSAATRLVALSAAGAPTADVPVTSRHTINCEVSDPSRCDGIVVHGDTVYTRPKAAAPNDASPVVALDVNGGRVRWSTGVHHRGELIPLGMDDTGQRLIAAQPRVIAARRGSQPPRVAAVDVATGRVTTLWPLAGKDDREKVGPKLSDWTDRHFARGRFVLVNTPYVEADGEVAVRAYGEGSP